MEKYYYKGMNLSLRSKFVLEDYLTLTGKPVDRQNLNRDLLKTLALGNMNIVKEIVDQLRFSGKACVPSNVQNKTKERLYLGRFLVWLKQNKRIDVDIMLLDEYFNARITSNGL